MAQRDALAQAKDAETTAKNKAISERDAEVIKNNESQERQQHLESANQDLQNRQQYLHEEMVKAEAQIELIKDLLLREQSL